MKRLFYSKKAVVTDILVECVKQGVLKREDAVSMVKVGSQLGIDVLSGLFEQMGKVVKYKLNGVTYDYNDKYEQWEKYEY